MWCRQASARAATRACSPSSSVARAWMAGPVCLPRRMAAGVTGSPGYVSASAERSGNVTAQRSALMLIR